MFGAPGAYLLARTPLSSARCGSSDKRLGDGYGGASSGTVLVPAKPVLERPRC